MIDRRLWLPLARAIADGYDSGVTVRDILRYR